MKKIVYGDGSKVLLFKEGIKDGTEIGNRIEELVDEIKRRCMGVYTSDSYEDLEDVVAYDKGIDCLLLSWPDNKDEKEAIEVINKLHESQEGFY